MEITIYGEKLAISHGKKGWLRVTRITFTTLITQCNTVLKSKLIWKTIGNFIFILCVVLQEYNLENAFIFHPQVLLMVLVDGGSMELTHLSSLPHSWRAVRLLFAKVVWILHLPQLISLRLVIKSWQNKKHLALVNKLKFFYVSALFFVLKLLQYPRPIKTWALRLTAHPVTLLMASPLAYPDLFF